MMSRGISPYLFGPAVLGVNAFSGLVDKLWADLTSLRGRLLWLAGVNATVVRHDELLAVVGFRVLALIGVVMIGIYVPRLARSYGRDPSVAFVLAVLNPLVLLHLVAGAHNDALMLGFLLAGLWFAREGRPVVGVLLCTIGAMIKIPAFVGVVYIGWGWLGNDSPWRSRLRPTITTTGIALLIMATVSQTVARWGWVTALGNSATVRSWSDPPTIAGSLTAKVFELVGSGTIVDPPPRSQRHRLAVGGRHRPSIAVALQAGDVHAGHGPDPSRRGPPRAGGATLVHRVVDGRPRDVRGAPAQDPRHRPLNDRVFLGLPGAGSLVLQFGEANPILIATASLAILLLLAIPLVMRLRRALSMNEDDGLSALPQG